MPRGFTDKEFDFFKSKLLKVGEELFSKHGLKKVSVEKITKEVGIAKGSFYKFYRNKEDLCYDCLMVMEKRVRAGIESELKEVMGKPGQMISKILHFIPKVIEENPLFAIFQDKGEMENLMLRVDPEKHKENFDGDILYFNKLFKDSGIEDENDIKGLISLIWGVVFLSLNSDFLNGDTKPLFILLENMIINYFNEDKND